MAVRSEIEQKGVYDDQFIRPTIISTAQEDVQKAPPVFHKPSQECMIDPADVE
jgi:hypothetical protein